MAMLASIFRGKELSLFVNTSFLLLLLLSFYFTTHSYPSTPRLLYQSKLATSVINSSRILDDTNDGCSDLHMYHSNEAKCAYLRSEKGCRPEGYIDYLQIFYCNCGAHPIFGYTFLILWLVVLFYLLGNTATNYFCPSLEGLSMALKLSPTIAGVTLLSLGNGAPDVFSIIVSFMGAGDGDVGLNSVLGGAFFVSSTVVGIISISIDPYQIAIDKFSFIRDVSFFLLALSSLLLVVIIGEISVWGAIFFVSIYLVYVLVVSTTHFFRKKESEFDHFVKPHVLPDSRSFFGNEPDELGEFGTPLLGYVDEEKSVSFEKGGVEDGDLKQKPWFFNLDSSTFDYYFGWFLFFLELPLYLPRRLTVPVVSEESWSKPFAVISVTLAPVLLAELWNSQRGIMGSKASLVILMIGVLVGIIFGILAFVTTEKSSPPKKYLLSWLSGGFIMSITWTYITAEELVALLVSLGHVLGINPSILGLTLLAWGNSFGDLMTNVAMAVNGGPDGVQVAMSGCYAGPIFNILMGLGLSLVFSSWYEYPSSFLIPRDSSLYVTLGFLMAALLWALVILPKRNMKPDRYLGGGLLAIYFCFLSLRLAKAVGLLQLHGSTFSFKP